MKVGIVGLPNVGKSTLFNALLKKQAALAANYPFATIEPNVGIVPVPDERLEILAGIVGSVKTVPATVEFVDIAGIVEGASKGEGLGNKFLAHIREVDVICHCLRYFTDTNVTHVLGKCDPQSDMAVIDIELQLADLETLEKQREPKVTASKEEKSRWEWVQKLRFALEAGKNAREVVPIDNEDAMEAVKGLHLLTMKPIIYILNCDENDLFTEFLNAPTPNVKVCAKIESELSALSDEEAAEYLTDLGLEESAINRLTKMAYEKLGLVSFLTAGEKEVRAWTIKKGWKAPQAAGVIHTDFEKNFIKAAVVDYNNFVEYNGVTGAKEKGLLRLEGKDYIMQEGDVVEFRVGV